MNDAEEFKRKHDEYQKQYDEFMKKYYEEHVVCPKCFSRTSSTYVGYGFDFKHPEQYKDENHVKCKCGWAGIYHDLVPIKHLIEDLSLPNKPKLDH